MFTFWAIQPLLVLLKAVIAKRCVNKRFWIGFSTTALISDVHTPKAFCHTSKRALSPSLVVVIIIIFFNLWWTWSCCNSFVYKRTVLYLILASTTMFSNSLPSSFLTDSVCPAGPLFLGFQYHAHKRYIVRFEQTYFYLQHYSVCNDGFIAGSLRFIYALQLYNTTKYKTWHNWISLSQTSCIHCNH